MAKRSTPTDRMVILHISGGPDDLGSGIADYSNLLVQAQRARGMESYYILSDTPVNRSRRTEGHIPVKPWSDDQEENERALEGVESRFRDRNVVWYVNMATPRCGTVASPEWLASRSTIGTIHECKIPDELLGAEKIKAEKKLAETVKYAKSLNMFMISSGAEARILQDRGVTGTALITPVLPNIDPRSSTMSFSKEKTISVMHFGMIRAKKGVELVLQAQQKLDGSGIKTALAGKVTDEFIPMFRDVITTIYDKKKVEEALSDTKYSDIFTSTDHKSIAADADKILQTIKEKRVTQLTNVDFYPNASVPKILELLHASQVGYLPFDRGATFHSGTLPAFVLCNVAVVSTKGIDTPKVYKERLSLLGDTDDETEHVELACQAILKLTTDEGALRAQLERQHELKSIYPQWPDLADKTIGMAGTASKVRTFQELQREAEIIKKKSRESTALPSGGKLMAPPRIAMTLEERAKAFKDSQESGITNQASGRGTLSVGSLHPGGTPSSKKKPGPTKSDPPTNL